MSDPSGRHGSAYPKASPPQPGVPSIDPAARFPPPPSLPNIDLEGHPTDGSMRKWTQAVAFLVAMSLTISAGLLVFHFFFRTADTSAAPTKPPAAKPTANGAPTAKERPAPFPSAAAAAAAEPTASAAPAEQEPPEESPPSDESDAVAAAREALERMRDGVKHCVEKNIGQLPGTSKPVPQQLTSLRAAYQAPASLWRSPVFHCIKFSISGPQSFQVQWQNPTRNVGFGVAWIDEDKDGRADQSLSFEATLLELRSVKLGPVVVDDEVRPVR